MLKKIIGILFALMMCVSIGWGAPEYAEKPPHARTQMKNAAHKSVVQKQLVQKPVVAKHIVKKRVVKKHAMKKKARHVIKSVKIAKPIYHRTYQNKPKNKGVLIGWQHYPNKTLKNDTRTRKCIKMGTYKHKKTGRTYQRCCKYSRL